MSVLVLDTDIASLSHKRRLSPTMRTRLATSLVCVTFVTVGELTRWEELYDWGQRRRAELAAWLHGVVKLPYDERTAYTWGRLSAAARKRGRPIADNDTWIAASCITRSVPLATRNVKHFEDFATHHGLELVRTRPGSKARRPEEARSGSPGLRQTRAVGEDRRWQRILFRGSKIANR